MFTVEWSSLAQDELARIWINASDRNAVTAAQARADRLLQADPAANGQHISEGYYRIHVPPLIISYTIDEDQNQVEVGWVRYRPCSPRETSFIHDFIANGSLRASAAFCISANHVP